MAAAQALSICIPRPDAIAGLLFVAIFLSSNQSQKYCLLAALFPQFIMPQQPQLAQYLISPARHYDCGAYDCDDGYATLAQRMPPGLKDQSR